MAVTGGGLDSRATERRIATVLFADVSGFTSMSSRMDPEDVREVMNRCFELLEGLVTSRAGHVDKYIGDCIMALFGLPRAVEAAARQAINSAIAMRERLERFCRDQRLPELLTIHVGINTGLVVAGDVGGATRRDFTVMGDAVNLASRLKDAAKPGEIFVGHDTWSETRHDFDFCAVRNLHLKGMASTLVAYRVTSTRERVHRHSPGQPGALPSILVGRDVELGVVQDQVAALRQGRGGVLSLVGDAGLGKSRLVAELRTLCAASGIQCLEARSISIGEGLRFHPFIDLLRQWAGIDDDDGETEARERLDAAVAAVLGAGAAEAAPFVRTLMGLRPDAADARLLRDIDPEALQKLIARSIRALAAAIAAPAPLVLCFEDLHWADASSITLLLSLVPLAREAPVLLVLVARPDYEQTTRRVFAVLRERFAALHTEIVLRPLDEHHCARILRGLIRHDDRPHVTRRVILGKTEGNPFFIQEVLRSLIDVGAIVPTVDGLRVTERIATVSVPSTISDVVMARVDRLSSQARQVLQLAAVLGRRFPLALVAAVADDREQIGSALAHLVRRQLLEETALGGEHGYAFAHALVQEAVYESLPRRARRDLHARVAATIETLYAGRLSDFYGMLAYHYGRAEALDKAREYLLEAGDQAERSGASSEALAYFSEAARLHDVLHGDGGDPLTRATLQKRIGLAYLNKGALEDALRHFDTALEHLGEHEPGSPLQAAGRLAVDLGAVLYQVYARRGRLGRRHPDPRTREAIEIRFHKGKAQSTSAPRGYFLGMMRGIRALGRIDPTTVDQACSIYAASAALFAFAGISFGVSARLLPLSQRLVRGVHDEVGYRTMAFLHHYLAGDWDDAHALPDALVEEGLRHGAFWEINTYLGLDCERRICQGRFDEAAACIDRLRRIGDDYGYDFVRGNEYFMTAFLALQRDDLAGAGAALERYYADRTEEALHLLALGTRARLHVLAGDLTAAREASTEADRIAARLGREAAPYHLAPHLLSDWLLGLAELEAAAGAASRAARTAVVRAGRRARAVARCIARDRPEAARLLGRQEWLLGRPRRAIVCWERAIAEAERLGAQPELARIHLEAGTRLAGAADRWRVRGLDAAALLARSRLVSPARYPTGAPR